LEPLGAQSLPLDSAAPGTRTTRAWTASQRNVKIGYATGVLAIAPNQQDVPGCTGKHANYKGLLIFLQGIQDYSGMTFHPRMRTFVPGHCRSPRKGRFNCESLTSFSGWPVLSCTEGGKQDMLTAKRVKRTILKYCSTRKRLESGFLGESQTAIHSQARAAAPLREQYGVVA
jgi:hypothetical protein